MDSPQSQDSDSLHFLQFDVAVGAIPSVREGVVVVFCRHVENAGIVVELRAGTLLQFQATLRAFELCGFHSQ